MPSRAIEPQPVDEQPRPQPQPVQQQVAEAQPVDAVRPPRAVEPPADDHPADEDPVDEEQHSAPTDEVREEAPPALFETEPTPASAEPAASDAEPVAAVAPSVLTAPPSVSPALPQGEDMEDRIVVRPYTWTGGRTRSSYDLRVETLVSTTPRSRDAASLTSIEHRAIADLCQEPRSVAEVAAHLSVPLGVVRVLLSDMAEAGLLIIHETEVGEDAAAQMLLMERVLSGLRRL